MDNKSVWRLKKLAGVGVINKIEIKIIHVKEMSSEILKTFIIGLCSLKILQVYDNLLHRTSIDDLLLRVEF